MNTRCDVCRQEIISGTRCVGCQERFKTAKRKTVSISVGCVSCIDEVFLLCVGEYGEGMTPQAPVYASLDSAVLAAKKTRAPTGGEWVMVHVGVHEQENGVLLAWENGCDRMILLKMGVER